MSTLFKDSEVLNKERPTKPTNQQIEEFWAKMAEEILDNNFSTSDKEDIISDLKNLSLYDTGFEMAKELDEPNANANYEIDSSFIEWLESLSWEYRSLNDKNVKHWVSVFNPEHKYLKGQALLVNENLDREYTKGKIVYVTGFSLEKACYLISEDKNRNGGTVLAYEKVESCCTESDA